MSLGSLLRRGLDKLGYVLWKRAYIRYGVDPFLDVQRLSAIWRGPVRTVFDVGANVGQTTVEALAAFPEAKILAFEPHPQTFGFLRARVSDERAALHNMALGDQAGDVTMYEYGGSGDASLANSLVPNARQTVLYNYKAIERVITCATLDTFCADNHIDRIDLLKIDVEGFEMSVLRGGEGLLRDGRVSFVYMEFNDLYPLPGAAGGSLLELGDYLAKFGFKLIATYTDQVRTGGELFIVANALFALPLKPGG